MGNFNSLNADVACEMQERNTSIILIAFFRNIIMRLCLNSQRFKRIQEVDE